MLCFFKYGALIFFFSVTERLIYYRFPTKKDSAKVAMFKNLILKERHKIGIWGKSSSLRDIY